MAQDDRTQNGWDADEFRAELRQWVASQDRVSRTPPAADPVAPSESEGASPRASKPAGRPSGLAPEAPGIASENRPAPIAPSAPRSQSILGYERVPTAAVPERSPVTVPDAAPRALPNEAPIPVADRPPIAVLDRRSITAPDRVPNALPERPPDVVHEGTPIALDEVLRRLGHVLWAEAVAVVEALCAVLVDADGTETPVPELSDISITARGTVLVRGRAVNGLAGPRLARTLHGLTASGAIPVALRLLITKWASSSEKHSIRTFAEELAYFARPNGALLIQAVYERCIASPSAAPPQPREPHSAPQGDQPLRPRRLLKSAWLGVAVLIIAAALLWLWREASVSSPAGASSRLATLMWNAAEAARRVAAAVSDRVDLAGTDLENSSESPEAPAPARASAASRPVAGSLSRSQSSEGGQQTARASDVVVPGVPADSSLIGTTADAVELPQPLPTTRGPSATTIVADVDDSSRIYSGEDPDVDPPTMRFPQLPAPLFTGVHSEVNTIEVVVSQEGTVERVRLVSTPRRMADMMLLSSAKTWKFEPASKQGRLVRYRLVVSWSATP